MNESPPRAFAVLPAAGLSRRMGRPKLLLPWNGKPLIAHTIDAFQPHVVRIVVVVRREDQELARVCRDQGVALVQPEVDPPDMKCSVACALEQVQQDEQPQASDCWLLAPADMPTVGGAAVAQCVDAFARRAGVYVATYEGKRGHPLIAPWSLVDEVLALDEGKTLKHLAAIRNAAPIQCRDSSVLLDIDTPEQYRRLVD